MTGTQVIGQDSSKQGLTFAVITALVSGLLFLAVAALSEQILFWLGSGHPPGQAYTGKVQDLAIFLAEAYVVIFLIARIVGPSVTPRTAIEAHLLSQTVTTYFVFAAISSVSAFALSAALNSTIADAAKGAVLLAIFPGSSLSLIAMSLASGALVYRLRQVRMWSSREMVWLYFSVLLLVVVLLALIFTSNVTV